LGKPDCPLPLAGEDRGPLRSNGKGEGNEVEVPSSIPFHFVKRAPFL
jgi:hypothetical protein